MGTPIRGLQVRFFAGTSTTKQFVDTVGGYTEGATGSDSLSLEVFVNEYKDVHNGATIVLDFSPRVQLQEL